MPVIAFSRRTFTFGGLTAQEASGDATGSPSKMQLVVQVGSRTWGVARGPAGISQISLPVYMHEI